MEDIAVETPTFMFIGRHYRRNQRDGGALVFVCLQVAKPFY